MAWTRALAPARRAALRTTATVLVILVGVVAITGYSSRIVGYQVEQPGDVATEDRVMAELDGGRTSLHIDGISVLQPAMTLTVELEARGQRLAVRGRYRSHWSDLQRRAPSAGADHDLWVVPAGQPFPAGCTDLGTYQRAKVCVITRTASAN